MSTEGIKDKVAVITGGASGIGRDVALEFAKNGAAVVIADIDEVDGARLQFEIIKNGGRALFKYTDVTKSADIEQLVSEAQSSFGSIDFAFNNAGIESGFTGSTADYDEALFLNVINVNLNGVWRCMKYQLEAMQEQGSGVIVNNASVLGKVGFKTASPYTAAKHGVVGLTKTAALEYAKKGIRINAICPGFIETPMLDRMGIGENEKLKQGLEQLHPMGRIGATSEIAAGVLWLCSSGASFVTGTTLEIDGGYLAR